MLPDSLLRSISKTPGFDEKLFREVHDSGEQVTSLRLNPSKVNDLAGLSFETVSFEPVPWSKYGYYLSSRPSFTFDPLFHAGCYYVQEASSMFLEQVLLQWQKEKTSLNVLDLSAAPGGKSTHLQSLLSAGSLLVSNEVIRSRAHVLEDNIIKWGSSNVMVTNNDPRAFSSLENFFDVIVIDAPCSGSGLFRREPAALTEWSEGNVQLCCGRQQRIITDAWPSLKENGLMIYSTCSYSPEEDEEISEWLLTHFPSEEFTVTLEKDWNIFRSTRGYRFWPYYLKGEGFYLSAFIKKEKSRRENVKARLGKVEKINAKDNVIAGQWAEIKNMQLVRAGNNIYAWPLEEFMSIISSSLQVMYSGVRVGEIIRDKLVPDHALALSGILPDSIPRIELEMPQAIDYLSKKDIHIETSRMGWHVVCFRGHELGWINALGKRTNNYYPKQLRILRDQPLK
jgi:16S rRNA C967 or C1407 C5-methylase (RsmB/RsmF family)/NOL1/NOP2/fmu family ribosome biogenesis protein